MAIKKIKLTLKTPEVLLKLGYKETTLDFSIDIEENKNMYQILSTDSDVIDWDFIDEQGNQLHDSKNETADTKDDPNIYSGIDISGYNELATLIEAVWRISKKSPAIIYGTNLFTETLKVEYDVVGSEPISINHAMLKMILEAYYHMIDINDAILDTTEKLKTNWKTISNLNTLVEVANQLYRIK